MTKYITRSLLAELGPNLLLIAIAALFSTFTLWLVQSPVKYVLFVFELLAIGVLYSTVEKNVDIDRFLNVARATAVRILKEPYSDVLLIVFSVILIAMNVTHIENMQEIQLFLSFLTTSVLSGYSLLKIFKLTKYFSRLEVLLLSFIVAFIFSGTCTLSLLSLDESIRSILIPFFYGIIGLISLLLFMRHKGSCPHFRVQRTRSLSRNSDLLAIALAIIFYIIFYSFTYPNFTNLPGSDISRHFSDSIILSRSPDLYSQRTSYILFHAFEATLHTISGSQQPVMSFQSIQVILNLLFPISIYVLAKRFLGNIDTRIAPLATIFYAIMSNFAFIYFTQLKLLDTSSAEIRLIGTEVADRAFNGTINFLQPFAWFVPISVSLIMFMVAFLLLSMKQIPRAKFVPLFSVVLLAMYLTHPSEAIIFVVLIAVYGFFIKRNDSLRLHDVLFSSLIALVAAGVITSCVYLIWIIKVGNANLPPNVLTFLVLPIVLVAVVIFWREKILRHLHFELMFVKRERVYAILSALLVVVYLFGLQSWIFIDTFKTSTVYYSGITPWFIYPLMLGIVGLLAILAIRYVPNIGPHGGLAFITASILIIFLVGRMVSFINVNYIITGYWEKRFLLFIFLLACLLAPISLIKFSEQLKVKIKRKFLANCSLTVVVSLIFLVGFSSMVLQSVYWFAFTSDSTKLPGKKEAQAITFLKNILDRDPHAFVITPTDASRLNLAFAAPGYTLSMPIVLFASRYPDVPLMALSAHNLDHAYIYMHERDFDFLKLQRDSWFGDHLLPMLPVIFSNDEVTIFNSSHVAYPASKSDSTMLIPVDSPDNSWTYAYDIISQSGKNYSVMFDTDISALKSKNVIMSFDPSSDHYIFYDNFSFNNHYWTVISGNWQIVNSSLISHDESSRIEQVVLSPVTSSTFKADTSFSVNRVNPKVASYASIVYSFKDDTNYRYSGINIYNNSVYVYFAEVNRGKTSFHPTWPGMKTGLSWKQGERFNLTLLIDGKDRSEHLLLNNFEYLKQQNNGESGRVGLAYGRMPDLVFTNFKAEDLRQSNLRNVSDYLTYVKGGGNLFVLNTNGYGSIADYLSEVLGRNIENNKEAKNSYTSSHGSHNTTLISPNGSFRLTSGIPIVESAIGRGKITYLDVHPMLSRYFEHSIPPATMFQKEGNLSKTIPMSPHIDSPLNFNNFKGIFKEMLATGKIKVATASVIFPSDQQFDRVDITTDKRIISLINITKLSLEKYDNLVLVTNNMSIANGRGLYANIILLSNNSATHYSGVLSSSDNMVGEIFVTSDKGELLHFSNVSRIELTNSQPIYLHTRQPNIIVNRGNITFNELYPLELYSKGEALSKNLRIEGNASFSVYLSDTFTFLRNRTVDGIAQREGVVSSSSEALIPDFTFSKLYSLPSIVRMLLIIPYILAAVFILYGGGSNQSSVPLKKASRK